jgi:apolipoprotein N-acyltransferase
VTRRVPRAESALALGSGFLVAMSMPPWGWWPLAFVGIALFEVSLGENPTRRERAARGWLFGAGWMFPALGWMWFLTSPGYVFAAALFAGFHALAALVSPSGPWRVIGRPAAHTLVEATRLFFPAGGVPLATLAIGQASGPLIGLARVGGVVLITWVVFQIGFALAGPSPFVLASAGRRAARAGLHGIVGLAMVAGVVVLSTVAPEGRDLGPTMRVALVQGGGPQGTRATRTSAREVVTRHLDATRTIEPGSADLVVWPENVVDVDGGSFADSADSSRDEVAAEAARLAVPLAVGITEDVAGRPGRFLNAQVVVTPQGEVTSRFDKVRRVPFGEYVPLRGFLESLGLPVDQIPTDAIAGTGPAVLHLPPTADRPNGTRLAVVISWEVFFGDRARDGVGKGGAMLLNPTNGSSYTGTILQSQQVASSRLRAVESGRWVAQVSPTGFSAFVSPGGDVHERTGVSERAVLLRELPLRGGETWYTTQGDWPIEIVVAVALAISLIVPARARRRVMLATAGPPPAP